MPIALPLDHRDQIERLKNSCQSQIDKAQELYFKSVFAAEFGKPPPAPNGDRILFETALFGIETVGYDLNKRMAFNAPTNGDPIPWRDLLLPAFKIRRALAIPFEPEQTITSQIESVFSESLDGVIANKQPELRYRLCYIDLDTPIPLGERWDEYLEYEIKRAFLLLVRRTNGYSDFNKSVIIIDRLRQEQTLKENSLNSIPDTQVRFLAAVRTLSLYNCAKAVETTGDYLRTWESNGQGRRLSALGTKVTIDRFIANACEILKGADPLLRIQIGRLGQAFHGLIDASVFSLSLPMRVQQFINRLSNPDRPEPLTELWYAQRESIEKSLFDLTKTAIVLSLPTSSGKTLLAELAMIHTHGDNPDARIIYLAPTRALVTQISLTLKRDFQGLDIKVQVATPAFELNPIESEILKSDYNVLVTTPEKLDLLIASKHESVANISLVIVDEAHNIADQERGAELEFLLAKLRRERNCRFILMTPFARNAQSLSMWLGGSKGIPVVIDWKPNDRVVGVVSRGPKISAHKYSLEFQSIETPRSDCPKNVKIDLGEVPTNTTTKERISLEAAKKLADVKKGGILLLAQSRSDAVKRARSIAAVRNDSNEVRSINIVCNYLDTEANGEHPLSQLLKKRVAFHHAGLSPESRYFVERLVEQGVIDILCATTTLAQGVHFPLSAAVIESYHRTTTRGYQYVQEELKPWELWNIAGRVGRTLQDSIGTVVFAARDEQDVRSIENYLKKDADIVISSIIDALSAVSGSINYDISLIFKYPSFSAFFRYLDHAAAILESNLEQSLDDLIRSSFAFLEAQQQGDLLVDKLLQLARGYIAYLRNKQGTRLSAYAQLTDGNGFTSFSMDNILNEWRNKPSLTPWQPDNLFLEGQPSEYLTDVMHTLGEVPEIRLGSHEKGPFSPARIARITSAWVNGASLLEIANREYKGDLLECTKHIYSAITNLVPWGLNVIQKVAFAGQEQVDWDTLDLLPSMVLHGVRTKEAIALRMSNVPRFVAERMASQIRESVTAIAEIPAWLKRTTPEDWSKFLPGDARISGADCKALWEILNGEKPWSSITN